MMKRGSILRQTCGHCWQIAAASLVPSDGTEWTDLGKLDSNQLSTAVAEYVANRKLANNVFVALDSKSVFPAQFSVSSASKLRDRRAMSYRVEELLPMAAEDFEVDFIVEGNDVLGIATPTRELLPVLDALEERGLHVQSVSPTVLIALQSLADENKSLLGDLLIWQDGDCLEVLRIRQRVQNWWNLPADPASLQQFLASRLLRSSEPMNIAVLGNSTLVRDAVAELAEVEMHNVESHSLAEHARLGAAKVLAESAKPWCELRRDKLITGDRYRDVRRELHWLQWSLACLMSVAAFFFGMRSLQYDNMVLEASQRQRTLFQEVFPNSQVPSAVVARLRSEKAKLSGARGKDAAVKQPPSALNVLYELLASIPATLRLQAQQLRIEDGEVYLDVKTRSVGDAGELADALEQRGFTVEPPTTEQFDAKQVSVRINGKLPTVPPGNPSPVGLERRQ